MCNPMGDIYSCLFDPKDISAEFRDYFEKVETECGAPWERVVEKTDIEDKSAKGSRFDTGKSAIHGDGRSQAGDRYVSQVVGWQPTCDCGDPLPHTVRRKPFEPIPCTILDPFAGAGTVGLVADRLQRDAILIELSPEYAEMARRRIADEAPMFASVAVERV